MVSNTSNTSSCHFCAEEVNWHGNLFSNSSCFFYKVFEKDTKLYLVKDKDQEKLIPNSDVKWNGSTNKIVIKIDHRDIVLKVFDLPGHREKANQLFNKLEIK